jgi:hypothetical protein
MTRATALNLIAWVVVPIAFASYVHFSYRYSLARGDLPFLGPHEMRWWIAFALSLLLGTICIFLARGRSRVRQLVWAIAYVTAMSVLLVALHVVVGCGNGDCI